MKDNCPFEAWQLIQARTVLHWLTKDQDINIDKQSFLERIGDTLFDLAYKKLGFKPIGKCSIEELQEEIDRRMSNHKN